MPPHRRAKPLLLLPRSNPPTEGEGRKKKAALREFLDRWDLEEFTDSLLELGVRSVVTVQFADDRCDALRT